jgi:hypothetical protein
MDEQLLTAAQAAKLVGQSRSLINFWRRRGWLQAQPTNVRGVNGYRESDVRAVAAMKKTAGWPRGRPRKPVPEGSDR